MSSYYCRDVQFKFKRKDFGHVGNLEVWLHGNRLVTIAAFSVNKIIKLFLELTILLPTHKWVSVQLERSA